MNNITLHKKYNSQTNDDVDWDEVIGDAIEGLDDDDEIEFLRDYVSFDKVSIRVDELKSEIRGNNLDGFIHSQLDGIESDRGCDDQYNLTMGVELEENAVWMDY
jgi:hypothetical protein